jgi:hypothetical protein
MRQKIGFRMRHGAGPRYGRFFVAYFQNRHGCKIELAPKKSELDLEALYSERPDLTQRREQGTICARCGESVKQFTA